MKWLILLWPVLAALVVNRSLAMQRFSLLHVPVAFYAARGVIFGRWGLPDFRDEYELIALVPLDLVASQAFIAITGWAVWSAALGYVFWWSRNRQAPRQFACLLAFSGMWMTLAGTGIEGAGWRYQFVVTVLFWQWALFDGAEVRPTGRGALGSAATVPEAAAIAQSATRASVNDDEIRRGLVAESSCALAEVEPGRAAVAGPSRVSEDGTARSAVVSARAAMCRYEALVNALDLARSEEFRLLLRSQAQVARDEAAQWREEAFARLWDVVVEAGGGAPHPRSRPGQRDDPPSRIDF